jgi:Icc-related predicted phosphoesterase
MHIISVEPHPFHELRYIIAGKRGGTETCSLPFVRGLVDRLPAGCDALIVTSDLQGVVPQQEGDSQLLGIAVADFLKELYYDQEVPSLDRCGVVLAGDLYSVPEATRRGGRGDVSEVWKAFASQSAWTIGVAGNHDNFSSPRELAKLSEYHHTRVLDGEIFETDKLRFGGVCFISGNPERAGRRDLEDQLALIDLLCDTGLDVLVLHEGPNGDDQQPGDSLIRERIVEYGVPLCICGHSHWESPLGELAPGVQVLNVDARVVILTARQP